MKDNEEYVYFALEGTDFDPDDITKLIGIAPTKKYKAGKSSKILFLV